MFGVVAVEREVVGVREVGGDRVVGVGRGEPEIGTVAVGKNALGLVVEATFVQIPGALDDLYAEAAADACDLVIALGSTLSVYPAAGVPLLAARRSTPYVIINRGETAHDALPLVTLRLDGDLGEIFPPAVDAALA